MRSKLIVYLKKNPKVLSFVWKTGQIVMNAVGMLVPIKEKSMMFSSFGGRKFDDSPKEIYDAVCKDPFFDEWDLIWAFAEPSQFDLQRGRKVRIDTPSFFSTLLKSKVWISNSGMTRGIQVNREKVIKVETWHGTPLKKIGGDENQNSMVTESQKKRKEKQKLDSKTIRCAQSEYDRKIFQRIFHATEDAILLCDLPRNDKLLQYTDDEIKQIKRNLGLSDDRKAVLYAPTYREYLIDEHNDMYLAPPMDLVKWEKEIGEDYVLLVRAHYAVSKALGIKDTDFVKDVSDYPHLNDLYIVSDVMISDYSSTYIDYSILDRPILCFAYDLEEFEEKRGLYIDLEEELPCPIDKTEDELLNHLKTMDYEAAALRTQGFHRRYAPYAGNASNSVISVIKQRLERIGDMK